MLHIEWKKRNKTKPDPTTHGRRSGQPGHTPKHSEFYRETSSTERNRLRSAALRNPSAAASPNFRPTADSTNPDRRERSKDRNETLESKPRHWIRSNPDHGLRARNQKNKNLQSREGGDESIWK